MPDVPPSTQKCAIFRGTAGEEIRFPLAGRDLTEIQALMCRTHPGCEYLGTEQAGIITPRKDDPNDPAPLFIGAVVTTALAGGVTYYLIASCRNPLATLAACVTMMIALVGSVLVLSIIAQTVWFWIGQIGRMRVFVLLAAAAECALGLYTASIWEYGRSSLTQETRVSLAGCFVLPLFALAVIYTFRNRNRP